MSAAPSEPARSETAPIAARRVTDRAHGRSDVRFGLGAAVLMAAFAWAVLVRAPSIPIAEVSASATLDAARFGPEKTFDECGVEAPGTECQWLLPDQTTGWIRYDFDDDYFVDRVRILNTMNDRYRDRSAERIRIELLGDDARTTRDTLPLHPKWYEHEFVDARARSVVIHIDSVHGIGGGLSEVAFEGTSATYPERAWRWFAAVALALAAGALAWRRPLDWRDPKIRSRIWFGVLSVALIIVAREQLRYSASVSTFEWSDVYQVKDIDTTAKAIEFFRTLMVPIPPVLALLELVARHATGTGDLVTHTLYKSAIVGAYLVAIALSYPSVARMFTTFGIAIVFIASTAAIHPGNPQVYDAVFPALLVAFVFALTRARARPRHPRASAFVWFVPGLLLALLGLTRPFGIVLVPLASALVVAQLGMRRRRDAIAFLLPVILIFGGWHGHLFVAHGQITMSNGTGLNLQRAWPQAPVPEFLPETFTPPYRAVNNHTHSINSRMVSGAIFDYVVTHPAAAVANVVRRIAELTEPKTIALDDRLTPVDDWLGLYRITVRALVTLFALAALRRASRTVRQAFGGARRIDSYRDPFPLDMLVLLTVACTMMTVVGESGREDARFLIGLLPMLAVTPALFPPRESRATRVQTAASRVAVATLESRSV